MVLLAFVNFRFYLVDYPPRVWTDPVLRSIQARYLMQVKPGSVTRFVSCCWFAFQTEFGSAFAANTPAGQFMNPSRDLPLVMEPPRDQVFILPRTVDAYLPVLQHYYPGGQIDKITGNDGTYVASAYKIPADRITSRYGVSATVSSNGSVVATGKVPTIGSLPPNVPTARYPLDVTWSGAFYIEKAGPATLDLEGATGRVWVMGQQVAPGEELTLDAGWVPFVVDARLPGPAEVRLLLGSGGAIAAIPTSHLWPSEPTAGLTVAIRLPAAPAGSATNVVTRVDPFVGVSTRRTLKGWSQKGFLSEEEYQRVYEQTLPLAPPVQVPPGGKEGDTWVRWSGEVLSDEGTYNMELRTDGIAQLVIDGKPVVSKCVPTQTEGRAAADVALKAGWHRVQLDLHLTEAEQRGLEWLWTRPDGVTEVVPPTRLRYAATATPEAVVQWPEPPTEITCPQ
jgi:hypothetical protein